MRLLLSYLANQCAIAKHHLYALARVCSEDKKRQLLEFTKLSQPMVPTELEVATRNHQKDKIVK